jgi:hypothetical protein
MNVSEIGRWRAFPGNAVDMAIVPGDNGAVS